MTALADRLLAGAGTDPGRQAAVRLLLALGVEFVERNDVRSAWMMDAPLTGDSPVYVAWSLVAEQTRHEFIRVPISGGEYYLLVVAASLAGHRTIVPLGIALGAVDVRLKREIVLAVAHAAGLRREWEHTSRTDETATVPAEVEGFPVGHLGGAP